MTIFSVVAVAVFPALVDTSPCAPVACLVKALPVPRLGEWCGCD